MGRKSKYSKQFKEDAVNLIIKEGYAIREAGRNLGIPEATLRLWKTEIEKENNPEYQEEKSDREEILRLKKRIKELEMEKEILKKATVFFAKESE